MTYSFPFSDITSVAGRTATTGWCTWKAVGTVGMLHRAARGGDAALRLCRPLAGLNHAVLQPCCLPTQRPAHSGITLITCCYLTVRVTCGPVQESQSIQLPVSLSPDDL